MKHSKSIQLKKNTCTVYELTVGDILTLFWLMAEYHYPKQLDEFVEKHIEQLITHAAKIIQFSKPTSLLKLSDDEKQAVLDLFLTVNEAFFQRKSAKKTEKQPLHAHKMPKANPSLSGQKNYQLLAEEVGIIITFGHSNALDYPYSFYLAIRKEFTNGGK